MSTAAAQPATGKALPLASFLGKLAPVNPVEKLAETLAPAVEAKAETKVDPKPVEPVEAKATPKGDEKPKDEQAEKRLKDTQSWGNEEHKARLAAEQRERDLKTRLERIEQKLDGTYEEPRTPSPEQLTFDAEMKGKIKASHRAAVRKHGEEYVVNTVWKDDSPYMKLQAANPLVAQRVMASDDPVQEALDVLQEEADAKKYGRTSEEMRKKIEEELRPQITKEVTDGFKTKPGPSVNTLGNVRGESDRAAQQASIGGFSLGKVFPHGRIRT